MAKTARVDQVLVERGLAESGEKARALVLAGRVLVAGNRADKPGRKIPADAAVELVGGPMFVSRGGEKLDAALDEFKINVAGMVCLDVGSSTGGFTDCLLRRGAARVYAVDVGKGLLHWRLRTDCRVVVMEETNARYLSPKSFPERLVFAVVDVAFISLTKILPAVTQVIEPGASIVTLIKPQFEAGRVEVDKGGGVVRDPAVRAAVVEKIKAFGTVELGLEWLGVMESPVKGPAGNVEFPAWWRKPGTLDGRQ